MARRPGRRKASRGATSQHSRKNDPDMNRERKRVRFQSPPSGTPIDGEPARADEDLIDQPLGAEDHGLSISSAGNRFNILQDAFSLPDAAFGEESGTESEGVPEAEETVRLGESSREIRPDLQSPWPSFLPDAVVDEQSDSGSETKGEGGQPEPSAPPLSLPSHAVGEEGSDESLGSPERSLFLIPSTFLPREPIGEASDSSDDDRHDGDIVLNPLDEESMRDPASYISRQELPQVVIDAAHSSPGNASPPLSPTILAGLLEGPLTLDFRLATASPPPSSGTPSTRNTPSTTGAIPLPPLSPLLGADQDRDMSAEDREGDQGLQGQLARARVEREVISAELEVISAAEVAAERMQQMPLPSLPQYWGAYQYGLALRGLQARAVWRRMLGIDNEPGSV
ncbi:hypothetical protein LXA43DRAFT_1102469 [Ganoderma leucocontextum]|nr:hypothetical protein LXA43DRAFT_1102469 [Ganoderma leucocontextum]